MSLWKELRILKKGKVMKISKNNEFYLEIYLFLRIFAPK